MKFVMIIDFKSGVSIEKPLASPIYSEAKKEFNAEMMKIETQMPHHERQQIKYVAIDRVMERADGLDG